MAKVVNETADDSEDAVEAPFDDTPLERLEHELVSMAAHLAAAEARWLAWLAAYDRRKGWQSWGCRSAAHWLNWKCAMSFPAARERVRVAGALEALPQTRQALAAGELSYSKARAITRAASPDSESDLVELARSSTAAQLDQICQGVVTARGDNTPNDTDADTDENPGEEAGWAKEFVSSCSNADGTSTLTVRLLDDAMNMLVAAIDTKVTQIIDDAATNDSLSRSDVIEHRGGISAVRAQAVTAIIVDGGVQCSVVVTVPVDAITAEPVPETPDTGAAQSVIKRLTCECRVNVAINDTNGKPLSVGRTTRVIPKAIRTALELRDHHLCQFPGCGATRALHAHHVVHWLKGGPTELDNLILLCSFHHRCVHDGNWNVEPHGDGFRFRTPTGQVATIEHSRGSVLNFYWYTREQVTEHTQLEPINPDRIQDLSWITTAILHNERNRQTHSKNTPAGVSKPYGPIKGAEPPPWRGDQGQRPKVGP